MDDCLIKATKRNRVVGHNGPRRNELKTFFMIDDNVPDGVINEIIHIVETYHNNDLGSDNYQISQHCDLTTAFQTTGGYRQLILQKCNDTDDIIDEKNYIYWRDDIDCLNIKKYLLDTFGSCYRARISVMPPGHDLEWHIDTDTSVLCRAQIVATPGSRFEFKTKTGEESNYMNDHHLYFINTGWTHRVINPTTSDRIVLIVGIDYDVIPNKEGLLV